MERIRYEVVEAAELPEQKGWMGPERLRELSSNQKIELILVNETKWKGRLASVRGERFVLSLDEGEQRELSFDEVATFRKASMSGATKALIIVGAVVGGLFLASYIAVATNPG